MTIVQHYCTCGRAALAPDNPNDRPVCRNKHKARAMKPGTVQVESRVPRLTDIRTRPIFVGALKS